MADGGFSSQGEDQEEITKGREKIDEPIIDDSDILDGTLIVRSA